MPTAKIVLAIFFLYDIIDAWGYSSDGRAIRSHRIGQGFESPYLHLKLLEAVQHPVKESVKSLFPRAMSQVSYADFVPGCLHLWDLDECREG